MNNGSLVYKVLQNAFTRGLSNFRKLFFVTRYDAVKNFTRLSLLFDVHTLEAQLLSLIKKGSTSKEHNWWDCFLLHLLVPYFSLLTQNLFQLIRKFWVAVRFIVLWGHKSTTSWHLVLPEEFRGFLPPKCLALVGKKWIFQVRLPNQSNFIEIE